MQLEEQNQVAVVPGITPAPDSTPVKKQHGGKRPGAGRKPNPTKLLKGVSRETLAQAVSDIDIAAVVAGLLRSKREVIRLQALNFLHDRMLGKPKQDLSVSGGIVHAHTRDPLLASLPKEALEELASAYDKVLSRHAQPVLDVPQDGPHNQVNSSVAIEAEGVASDG